MAFEYRIYTLDLRKSGREHLFKRVIVGILINFGGAGGRRIVLAGDNAECCCICLQIRPVALDEPKANGDDEHDAEHGDGPIHVGHAWIRVTRKEEENRCDGAVNDGDDVACGAVSSEIEAATGRQLVPSNVEKDSDWHRI